MNKKTILNLILAALVALMFSSCLDMLGGSDFPEDIPTEEKELALLEVYLDTLMKRNLDIDTTSLGVYYITMEEGEGDYPAFGDSLTVGYAGYFVDGTLFDASNLYEEGGVFEFILGETPMIEGWNDAMTVINKNAKVQIMIPSRLAYGATGMGSIPPFSTLIFVVEMKEIRPS